MENKPKFKIGDIVRMGNYPKNIYSSEYPSCDGTVVGVFDGKCDGTNPNNTGVYDYLIKFDNGDEYLADDPFVIEINPIQRIQKRITNGN